MARPLKCHNCGSPLEASQRYCVECGVRTRGLPAGVRSALVAMAGGLKAAGAKADGVPGGSGAPGGPGTPSGSGSPGGAPDRKPPRHKTPQTFKGPFGLVFTVPEFEMPSPRAMAAAVLGLLAFGVGIGAANVSFAGAPLDLILNVPYSTTSTAATTPVTTGSTSAAPTQTSTAATTSSATTAPATTTTGSGTGTTTTASNGLPPIDHVWIITLSDQGYNQSFSAAGGDSYLSSSLGAAGEVVPYYYGVASGNLANDIAMLSGQGPTKQTAENCPDYTAFKPSSKKQANYNQLKGEGCVYPKSVPTLMSELQKAGDTWKAYVQGQGTKLKSLPHVLTAKQRRAAAQSRARRLAAARERRTLAAKLAALEGFKTFSWFGAGHHASRGHTIHRQLRKTEAKDASELSATCRHPNVGAKDPFHSGASGYATWENPVLYFDSVVDSKNCAKEDVGLSQLSKDLNNSSKTPNLSLIYPDPCDNGSDTKCSPNSTTSGTAGADSFLQKVLPLILNSAAYKSDGLVIITFDQAPQSGEYAGLRHYSCCSTPAYPNVTAKSLKQGAKGTGPVTSTGPCTTTTTTTTGTGTTTTGTGTATTTTGTGTGTTTTGTGTTTTATTPQCTTTTQTPPPCLIQVPACGKTGGGGDVGMLAISPCIKPKSLDTTDQGNHFSLLYELEDLFELPDAIGDSANPDVQNTPGAFPSLFNNAKACPG